MKLIKWNYIGFLKNGLI